MTWESVSLKSLLKLKNYYWLKMKQPMKLLQKKSPAALAAVDSEFGRTTDPVRMYMREMGSVELLSREGEIAIAKRIEEGMNQMLTTLAYQPQMIAEVLGDYDRVEKGEMRLSDIISGYIEPNIFADEDG